MSAPDVRSFTVGPVQENSYIVRPDGGSRSAVMIDPGDEPAAAAGGGRRARGRDRGDPAHALPLRPHRGRRAGRPRHRRARVLPGDRASRAVRRDALGASRLRPLRELRGRPHPRRWGAPAARGTRHRGPVHAGPQPGPPHLRHPRRPAVRRRPVPGVGRKGGPPGRRLAHAGALDRRPARPLPR